MVSFFEQGGKFIRCEARDGANGGFELLIQGPDGPEQVEYFDSAEALDARMAEVQHRYQAAGWFGPYGRRS
jgi:hypothetical protein